MDEPSSFESLNERLPISTKIYYGIGYVPVYCNLALLSLFHSPFLLEVAQISPFYVGSLLIIGQIWDALIDPVIGYLSDKTRTKWGRRRPWMFVGSLTLGTSFCSLWQVFRIEDEFGRWIYYTVTFLLFKTFMTLFAVPYGAMLPELTPNYNERTNLVTYKVMIAYSITLLLGFGQARLLAQLAHPRISYIIGSIISSLVFTGSALITTLCLRETPIKELELKKIQNEKEGEFVNDNENNDNTNIIGDEEESRSRLKEVVLEVYSVSLLLGGLTNNSHRSSTLSPIRRPKSERLPVGFLDHHKLLSNQHPILVRVRKKVREKIDVRCRKIGFRDRSLLSIFRGRVQSCLDLLSGVLFDRIIRAM
eukprot:TRINITY_DN904_c0_g1_i6.p1 TRINITY_DN904_c0_g1~~TRINITY_DN904_c0_g1_i6.p1  ORF type:complete len:364 (+),score=56.55 TRINITY_DN904_c0_g1_i6:42-1133(+)